MSDTPTTPQVRTLIKKLAEVMNDVGRIEKKGWNAFHKYKYVMEADLVETLSAKLAERHVFITSSTKNIEVVELGKVNAKTGEITPSRIGVLRVEYTFHDGESGETLTMESIGEIDQDGGKGLYKALTGSMKYFLMKNFLIATGDDPEQDSKKTSAAGAPSSPASPKKVEPKPATDVQLQMIAALARDLGKDPIKDIYEPFNITTGLPTEAQAGDIIKILQQKKSDALKAVEQTESK